MAVEILQYLRLGEGDLRRRGGEGERRLRTGEGERRFLRDIIRAERRQLGLQSDV